MPEAARAHTPEGAEAFVRHFWAVVDYGRETLDTEPIRALSRSDCKGCLGGIRALGEIRKHGGRIRGGQTTISELKATGLKAGDQVFYDVTFLHTNAPEITDYPGTDRDVERDRVTKPTRMRLFSIEEGWEVAQLGPAQ
ncbi:MAG TPA: DUF6318 family protein [Nocardioides sp.]